MSRILITSALLFALLAAPAAASSTHQDTYPGLRATANPTIQQMTAFALNWWSAKRGLAPTCGPIEVRQADDLTDKVSGSAEARAWLPALGQDWCGYAILSSTIDNLALAVSKRWHYGPLWGVRQNVAATCATVVHEVGHLVGRALPIWNGIDWIDGHPLGKGVMSNRNPHTPPACARLARDLVRRAHVRRAKFRADRYKPQATGRADQQRS
jgi:hypothetical protein